MPALALRPHHRQSRESPRCSLPPLGYSRLHHPLSRRPRTPRSSLVGASSSLGTTPSASASRIGSTSTGTGSPSSAILAASASSASSPSSSPSSSTAVVSPSVPSASTSPGSTLGGSSPLYPVLQLHRRLSLRLVAPVRGLDPFRRLTRVLLPRLPLPRLPLLPRCPHLHLQHPLHWALAWLDPAPSQVHPVLQPRHRLPLSLRAGVLALLLERPRDLCPPTHRLLHCLHLVCLRLSRIRPLFLLQAFNRLDLCPQA